MGNEQQPTKKNVQGQIRQPVQKNQFDCMCLKLKGYFEITIQRKQAEVNNKCKQLFGMIRAPQRDREAELHKMISIQQDRNYIKGLEMLLKYTDILFSRSQIICQSQGNPQVIKDLMPIIEGLVWSTKYVNLKSLGEFTTVMRNFFGGDDFYAQVQNSTLVDIELKKCFDFLPQNAYCIDLNNLALLLCQQGLTIEEINKAGHPFSQNAQQFYQNIGQNSQQNQQSQQNYPQYYPQQQQNTQQFQQNPQQFQQNQYQQQQQQYPQPNINVQNLNQNKQSLPINNNQYNVQPQNFQSNIPGQNQYQNQQNQGQPQQNYQQNNAAPQGQNQFNNQGYQINVQQAQPNNQQQNQANNNGIQFNHSIQVSQNNQFGNNFVNSYDDIYKSNNIGNQDDYSYPTFSKINQSQNVQDNKDDDYVYIYNNQQQQLPNNNNQLNPNQQNQNQIQSNINPAKQFTSNNQINNGQLPNNFKFHNMMESKDIQFAAQINNNLNYIAPNGQDISKLKEQIGDKQWNVDITQPQLNVQPSNEQVQIIEQQVVQLQIQDESPSRNQIKYPSLNKKQNIDNVHQQQINSLQNNIKIQAEILTLKKKDEELNNDLQSKLQMLQQQLQIQCSQPGILPQQPQNVSPPKNQQNPIQQNNNHQQQNNNLPFQNQNNAFQNQNNTLQKTNTLPNNNINDDGLNPANKQIIYKSYAPQNNQEIFNINQQIIQKDEQNNNSEQNNMKQNIQIQQSNNSESTSNFQSRIQIMDMNQILKEMCLDPNDKNIQQILKSYHQQQDNSQQGQNNNNINDLLMSNIIKEINDNRNSVNYTQNEYQGHDDSAHPKYQK